MYLICECVSDGPDPRAVCIDGSCRRGRTTGATLERCEPCDTRHVHGSSYTGTYRTYTNAREQPALSVRGTY